MRGSYRYDIHTLLLDSLVCTPLSSHTVPFFRSSRVSTLLKSKYLLDLFAQVTGRMAMAINGFCYNRYHWLWLLLQSIPTSTRLET